MSSRREGGHCATHKRNHQDGCLDCSLAREDALQQRLTAADERADVLERDAARYRWLRDVNVGPHMIDHLLFQTISDDCNPPYRDMKHGVDLDEAIDAALKP